MCGIIGYLSASNHITPAVFASRRDRMSYRGPDDAGYWRNNSGTVQLGQRRLAILDLSPAGHQPMVSDCGRFTIVLNGEVYNYLELKNILESKGYRFRGGSDTEVVLAAYCEWGTKCVERLNGMFAFAVYAQGDDKEPEHLFIARDRVGKKPFYYRHSGTELEFASELKALTGSGGMDLQALNHYLALGYIPFDLCISKGIKKLPPAHAGIFHVRTGELKIWKYWVLPKLQPSVALTGERLAAESWDLLKDSIRLRLRSDVPVGVFLSGGLDSSLITAATAEVSSQPVKTFTISVPGSKLDEAHHARLIADYFNTEHHVLELPVPTLDILDELASFVDEPLADSSIIPSYLVSKLTARHVKVALGGDGGDELYGGYRHYQRPLHDQINLRMIPRFMLKLAGNLAAKLPAGVYGRNRVASLRGGINYSRVWGTPFFDVELRKRILHPDLVHQLGDELDLPERNILRLMADSSDIVDSLTRADFHSVLPDDFLVKVDRASMANSLEVRSPFLDYRLVEHAFGRIPANWKANYTERRRIQNIMAKLYLPESYELNRKQGFSIPIDVWLRKSDPYGRMEGMPDCFNRNECESLLKGHMNGRANGARLFALMILIVGQRNISMTIN